MKFVRIDWIHTIWKKYLDKKREEGGEEEDSEESEDSEEEEEIGWNTDMILDTLDGFRLAYRVNESEGWYQYCEDEKYYYLAKEEEEGENENENDDQESKEEGGNEGEEGEREESDEQQPNPTSLSVRVVYSCLSRSHLEYLIKQVCGI